MDRRSLLKLVAATVLLPRLPKPARPVPPLGDQYSGWRNTVAPYHSVFDPQSEAIRKILAANVKVFMPAKDPIWA